MKENELQNQSEKPNWRLIFAEWIIMFVFFIPQAFKNWQSYKKKNESEKAQDQLILFEFGLVGLTVIISSLMLYAYYPKFDLKLVVLVTGLLIYLISYVGFIKFWHQEFT